MASPGDTLSERALNRALLARQGLLERVHEAPDAMLEQLVGMQNQVPLDPYLGLWGRLADFDPDDLGALVETRRVVRGYFAGLWKRERSGRDVTMRIELGWPVRKRDERALRAEAERALAFIEPRAKSRAVAILHRS